MSRGLKGVLGGRLHPAKEKTTKEEVQKKKTELHRKEWAVKKGGL